MTKGLLVIAPPILEAIEQIRKIGNASDLSEPHISTDQIHPGWVEFACLVRPSVQVGSTFPHRVAIRVLIHPEFPLGEIEVYPVAESIRYYAHQDGETAKLCLHPDHKAPLDISRLSIYINWAKEWLEDAAAEKLLKPGDPYELPDFGRKNSIEIPSFLFQEDARSFEFWRTRFGGHGSFEYVTLNDGEVAFVRRFLAPYEERSLDWGSYVPNGNREKGIWILCSKEPVVERRRPPLKLHELWKILKDDRIEVRDLASAHWELAQSQPTRIAVLLGFPISPKIGSDPSEVHWQPLFLENWTRRPKNMKGGFLRSLDSILTWSTQHPDGPLHGSKPLAWGRSTNVSPERVFARGSLPGPIQHSAFTLIGCGALGCKIAEMLVRAGLREISLLDKDTVEPGNLVRHNCEVGDIQHTKAQALGRRLEGASPHVRVSAFAASLPPQANDGEILEALRASQIWIDCTGNDRIFAYLNQLSQSLDKILIHMYITWDASFLCASSGGARVSSREVHDVIMSERGKGTIPEEFFMQPKQEELVIEGAGCWHPTFPATGYSIDHLASGFVSQLARFGPRALTIPWGIVISNPWLGSERVAGSPPIIWLREFS